MIRFSSNRVIVGAEVRIFSSFKFRAFRKGPLLLQFQYAILSAKDGEPLRLISMPYSWSAVSGGAYGPAGRIVNRVELTNGTTAVSTDRVSGRKSAIGET